MSSYPWIQYVVSPCSCKCSASVGSILVHHYPSWVHISPGFVAQPPMVSAGCRSLLKSVKATQHPFLGYVCPHHRLASLGTLVNPKGGNPFIAMWFWLLRRQSLLFEVTFYPKVISVFLFLFHRWSRRFTGFQVSHRHAHPVGQQCWDDRRVLPLDDIVKKCEKVKEKKNY